MAEKVAKLGVLRWRRVARTPPRRRAWHLHSSRPTTWGRWTLGRDRSACLRQPARRSFRRAGSCSFLTTSMGTGT